MQYKRTVGILIGIAILLLLPLIAMQFTNEVVWDWKDFAVMGFLLLSVGLVFELAFRAIEKTALQVAIIGGAVLIFLVIWAELAVGIFGTSFAGS